MYWLLGCLWSPFRRTNQLANSTGLDNANDLQRTLQCGWWSWYLWIWVEWIWVEMKFYIISSNQFAWRHSASQLMHKNQINLNYRWVNRRCARQNSEKGRNCLRIETLLERFPIGWTIDSIVLRFDYCALCTVRLDSPRCIEHPEKMHQVEYQDQVENPTECTEWTSTRIPQMRRTCTRIPWIIRSSFDQANQSEKQITCTAAPTKSLQTSPFASIRSALEAWSDFKIKN